MRSSRHALVGVAIAGSLLLSACTQSASSAQTADSLVWSMWIAGQADQDAWQQVADQVPADGGPEVAIQGAPFNDYWTKLGTQLSLDTPPCIVTLQSLRAANYTVGLRPLDDLLGPSDLDGFDETALEGMRVDGELYGIPYDTGPMVMFYNVDLFTEAGIEPEPGWSVEEFEEAAAALAEQGTPLLATSAEDLPLEATVLAYNGGRILDEDGTLDVTDTDVAAGLDWLGSLVQQGWATPASGSDPSNDDNDFISERAAAYVDGPWGLISQSERAPFEVGVTTLPIGHDGPSTLAAGSGFGVSASCPYPEEAVQAIRTMTGDEVLTALAEAGRALPARTELQQVWVDSADVEGVERALAVAREDAVPRPGHPLSDRLNLLLAQYAILAVNGQLSGTETLQQIQDQLPNQP